MDLCYKKGRRPLIAVVYVDGIIKAVAPFAVREKYGFRFARFLFESHYLPDFLCSDSSESSLYSLINLLTGRLNYKFITLEVANDSKALISLEKTCPILHVSYAKKDTKVMGRRIIKVNCSWDDFLKNKDHKFRSELKRVDKRIKTLGNCVLKRVDSIKDDSEVFNKINKINDLSWKKRSLEENNWTEDPDMVMILSAIKDNISSNQPVFEWNVCFLELDGNAIAYVLILQLNGTAIIKRTAFIESYRAFSPGIYVLNYALKEIFDKKNAAIIDFCSDHPYMERWTDTCIPRTIIAIRKGVIPFYTEKLLDNDSFRSRVLRNRVIF